MAFIRSHVAPITSGAFQNDRVRQAFRNSQTSNSSTFPPSNSFKFGNVDLNFIKCRTLFLKSVLHV